MKMKHAIPFATAVAVLVFAPLALAGDREPTPERVARHCVQRISRLTHAGTHEMAQICRRTVTIVEELVEAGQPDRAREAAEAGARRVTRAGQATVEQVRMTVEHCVRILQRLEADPEIIRIVVRAGERSRNIVGEVQRACLRAIANALGDNG